MKKFCFSLLAGLLIFTSSTFGQNVSGVVTEKSGEPLLGVAVSVKNKPLGITTGLQGDYSLSGVNLQSDSLIFSYLGKVTQTVPIAGRTTINIQLEDSNNTLDDVVVIGYGNMRRGDLAGAVSSISAEDILRTPTTTVGEALLGKVAGVQVMTADGAPDADVSILVRGRNSITQSSAPLYIVDGFPVESISHIAPADIGSMDILKDASSTAIYGSRGANGVIMITTRNAGKEGKLNVSFSSYVGIKSMAPAPDVLDPYEYALWQYEQSVYRNEVASRYEPFFGVFEDMHLYKGYKGNNWKDIVFGGTGSTINYNVSLSGRTDKMNYTASYSSMKDNAIMITSDYRRDNFSFKFQHRPARNFTIDFNTRFSNTQISGSGANEQSGGRSSDTRMKYVMQYSPIPMKGGEITEGGITEDDFNTISSLFTPTEYIRDNDRLQQLKNLNLSGSLTWQPVKDLKLKTSLTVQNDWNEDKRYFGVTTYYSRMTSTVRDHPATGIVNTDKQRIYNSNTIDYNFRNILPKIHDLTLMVGEETSVSTYRIFTNNVDGYPVDFDSRKAFKFTSMGTPVRSDNFYGTPDKLLSFFTRLNYIYDKKYILTASLRADASTKFTVPTQGGYNNLWGYFPAVALAWRMSDENFLKDVQWLSNLKLRASFGMAGNDNIPSAQTLSEFAVYTTSILPFGSSTPWLGLGNNMPNPSLKWETTITRNIGIDFGFFNHRINGSIDLYQNTTKDLLIRFPVKGVGYTDRYSNIGVTENKGIELVLNAVILQQKNVDLQLSFNVAMNRNKVVSLGGLKEIQAYSAWASSTIDYDFLVREGQPLGLIYGYITDGRYSPDDFVWDNGWKAKDGVVDNKHFAGSSWGPGAIKFKDLGGDPLVITPADDRTILGSTLPKATGGFVLSGRIYGFDFNANFNYTLGNKILNVNKAEYTTTGSYRFQNMLTTMDSSNRWKGIDEYGQRVTDPAVLEEMNRNTTMWNPLTAYRFVSDYIVEDGSFLRLSAATIGYTVPSKYSRKLKIESLRFYVTGTNLWLLTKYTGFDPEVDTRRSTPLTPGVDYSPYPKTRGVIFGININF